MIRDSICLVIVLNHTDEQEYIIAVELARLVTEQITLLDQGAALNRIDSVSGSNGSSSGSSGSSSDSSGIDSCIEGGTTGCTGGKGEQKSDL